MLEAYGILIHYKDDDQKDLVHERLTTMLFKQWKKENKIDDIVTLRTEGIVLYYFRDQTSIWRFPKDDNDLELESDVMKGCVFQVEKEPNNYLSDSQKEFFLDLKERLLVERIGCIVGVFIFKKPTNPINKTMANIPAESLLNLI